MLKVVIIGYGEMFTNLIAGTLDAGCQIVGVFRGEMINYSPLKRWLKDCLLPSGDYAYIRSYNLHEINARSVNSEKFRKELIQNILKYAHDHMSLITVAVLIKKKFTLEELIQNYYAGVNLFENDCY